MIKRIFPLCNFHLKRYVIVLSLFSFDKGIATSRPASWNFCWVNCSVDVAHPLATDLSTSFPQTLPARLIVPFYHRALRCVQSGLSPGSRHRCIRARKYRGANALPCGPPDSAAAPIKWTLECRIVNALPVLSSSLSRRSFGIFCSHRALPAGETVTRGPRLQPTAVVDHERTIR